MKIPGRRSGVVATIGLAVAAATVVVSAARSHGEPRNPLPPGATPAGSQRASNVPDLPPPQRFTVQSNGHPLAVWARIPSAARGAVVLVHGRTWSSRPDFDLDVPGLQRSVLRSLEKRGLAAYALDMRGYGETPRDSTGWLTPPRAAADVIAVLGWVATRHPTGPRPALLGWSTGAEVAHLVAARSPSSLSALVLAGYAPDPESSVAVIEGPPFPLKGLNTREAAAADFISPKVTPEAVVKAFVETAIKTDPVLADWSSEDQFICDSARVSVPTLMLYGERDPNIEARNAREFYAHLGTRDKQVVVFPGADHCAHLENTHDAWVTAVVNFLHRYAIPGR